MENGFIRLKELCYSYPKGDFALSGIDLSFGKGQCTALMGGNGSGKTTLGKLMAGVLRPKSGSVIIDGEPAEKMTLAQIGRKVGYLFQEPSRQLFAPTVAEEITFVLGIKGIDTQKAAETAQKALSRFKLEHLADKPTIRLSRGEKQRLAIAAILVNDPGFLILDEPTTGLDSERRDILSCVLSSLLEIGVGIMLISHDEAFVKRHAAKIVFMRREGDTATLQNGETLYEESLAGRGER